MNGQCTLQLFAQNVWHDVASVTLWGESKQGWRTPTSTGYALEWAADYMNKHDAWALSSATPVSFAPQTLPHWPVFLLDMLPRGFGRIELLNQLGLPEIMEDAADWRLLLAGAGNPIGHLRIKEAAEWLRERSGPRQGFSDQEVAQRSEEFIEYLGAHGLFVAGSSGVQGEWPKILLTRAQDGLLYLDHSLTDGEAQEHYIVKFGRGPNARLAQILRQEAAYMAIAKHLGLNVYAPLTLKQSALFIPRFDRRVTPNGVERIAQESIAAMQNLPGFGVVSTHDAVCLRLAQMCTDPQVDIIEYIKRDIANLAFGNKDNHARNTALQRHFDGTIKLAPLFDFAPMYLHPDGIARRTRWENNDGVAQDWNKVLDVVCATCHLPRAHCVNELQTMIQPLHDIARDPAAWGLEPDVAEFLFLAWQKQIDQLLQLH